MEISRKIGNKSFAFTQAQIAAAVKGGKRLYLGRIAGIARDSKAITTQYGVAMGLIGDFMCIRHDDTVVRSATCYLPGGDTYLGQIASALKESTVEFALDFYAEFSEKGSTGYAYVATTVLEPSGNDPLMTLASALPALPIAAPAQTELLESDTGAPVVAAPVAPTAPAKSARKAHS